MARRPCSAWLDPMNRLSPSTDRRRATEFLRHQRPGVFRWPDARRQSGGPARRGGWIGCSEGGGGALATRSPTKTIRIISTPTRFAVTSRKESDPKAGSDVCSRRATASLHDLCCPDYSASAGLARNRMQGGPSLRATPYYRCAWHTRRPASGTTPRNYLGGPSQAADVMNQITCGA